VAAWSTGSGTGTAEGEGAARPRGPGTACGEEAAWLREPGTACETMAEAVTPLKDEMRSATGSLEDQPSSSSAAWSRHAPVGATAAAGRRRPSASCCGRNRKNRKQVLPADEQQDRLLKEMPGLAWQRMQMLACWGLLGTPQAH
jgi:hypothetical protein